MSPDLANGKWPGHYWTSFGIGNDFLLRWRARGFVWHYHMCNLYRCVCVCVCVCVRGRGRGRESGIEREGEREGIGVCLCECMFICGVARWRAKEKESGERGRV